MKSKNNVSIYVAWLLAILIIYGFFTTPRRGFTAYNLELSWDILSYYVYLPFTFIYDDPGISQIHVLKDLVAKYNLTATLFQVYPLENGNHTPNYTMGMALLFSPFFFIGHLWAKTGGFAQDGFSFPYQFSIAAGMLLYILPGIFFLRKLLKLFFNESTVVATLIIMVLGTNYLHEAFNDYMYPHAPLFTGYILLIYYTIKWHESPSVTKAAVIGFIAGLMVLIRPSEILCVIIPLVWDIWNQITLKRKIRLVKNNIRHFFPLIAGIILPWIPQILYWKYVTGSWLFFSYQHTEGFDFEKPHILSVLFSYKKSLFVYTPLLILAIWGIIIMRRKMRPAFYATLVFVLCNFYLLSSWAAWWNGGSFGMRYFVESYGVLALPFALATEKLITSANKFKYLAAAVIAFLIYVNLFQTWQYVNFIIPADGMTKKYYWKIFLKKSINPEDALLLETKRTYGYTETFSDSLNYNHYTLGYLDFEDINSILFDRNQLDSATSLSKPFSFRMDKNYIWGPAFHYRFSEIVPKGQDHLWLRLTCSYYTNVPVKDNPLSAVFNMPHKKYNLKYKAFGFEEQPFVPGVWNQIKIDYMTPYPYDVSDPIDIYFWHRGNFPVYIDNVKIEAFEKK